MTWREALRSVHGWWSLVVFLTCAGALFQVIDPAFMYAASIAGLVLLLPLYWPDPRRLALTAFVLAIIVTVMVYRLRLAPAWTHP